jgi:hypothetical protein
MDVLFICMCVCTKLLSLFFFTGTFDLNERPLVVVDCASIVKASVDSHQIASLLLYYATLPR